MTISGVILTKNEEDQIKECIENLDFCDEVIVVDDMSKDKTVAIAKACNVKVYSRDMKENFADQRNFALSKVKNKWVLFVDSDERVPEELESELLAISCDEGNSYLGYYVKRLDCFFDKVLKHGENGSVKLLRFGRHHSGKWERPVHERWNVVGKTGTLKNPLIHAREQNLQSFIGRINYFSKIHARANYEEGKRSSLLKIVFLPPLKFINNYFFKLGILDGFMGFLAAILMSFHSYLAWSSLWLMQKNIHSQKS